MTPDAPLPDPSESAIHLPYNWEPRYYQVPLWEWTMSGGRFAIVFWHRRAGKDLTIVNRFQIAAMERIGAYWHVFPTYRQGKKIAWEGATKDGRRFIDHFHPDLITNKREQELTLDFVNPHDPSKPGSTYSIIGADNPDSQVGTNPVGIVFSEYALYESPEIWNRLQPIIAENGGWVIFITTPRGRNHAYRLYRDHLDDPEWFTEVLSYKDTGAIDEREVLRSIKNGMSTAMARQEYECSFDAQLENAYFGEAMEQAAAEGRVGLFPHDTNFRVETWWDIGHGDETAIWFVQKHMGAIRVIDFEAKALMSLPDWIGVLEEKARKHGYKYSEHLLPHDSEVTEWGTGKTRLEQFYALGIHNVRPVPKIDKQSQIDAARSVMARCYFHEPNCDRGLQALREYQRKKVANLVDDENRPVYSKEPLHNWASNPADAFQTGAVGSRPDRHRDGEDGPLAAEVSIV